jgi:hypothetical protein
VRILEGSAQQQENQLRYPTQQRGDNEVPKKSAKVAYGRHAEDVSSGDASGVVTEASNFIYEVSKYHVNLFGGN